MLLFEATTQYDISFILSKMKNRKFTLLPLKKSIVTVELYEGGW